MIEFDASLGDLVAELHAQALSYVSHALERDRAAQPLIAAHAAVVADALINLRVIEDFDDKAQRLALELSDREEPKCTTD